MKTSIFFYAFFLSFHAWSQDQNQKPEKRKSFVERRSEKARKNMEDNFSSETLHRDQRQKQTIPPSEEDEKQPQESDVDESQHLNP